MIGPTTFTAEAESTDGTISARPISPYGYPILIAKDRARVLELRYSFQDDGGRPLELSLPSQHLGDARFEEIAWQSSPQRQAWLRRGNGELVVMIYDPDQDVLGWAVAPQAGGFVESLSVTQSAETGYDILTMVVRREVDGQILRMVEEQATNWSVLAGNAAASRSVHLFSALEFSSDVTFSMVDLPHLVGRDVWAWTDVGNQGPFAVPSGGRVELPLPCRRAVVGLFDDTHQAETLNLQASAPDGSSMGRPRRIHSRSGIQVHRTAGGHVRTVERRLGVADRLGDAYPLVQRQIASDGSEDVSGTAESPAASGYASDVSLRFEPEGGAPMTITATNIAIEEEGA